ncbi:MAG: FtsX-like permease family protein [Halieaceae bacterium]|jgi:lipoprotein-releasing system permease protein|nr:FtsX-like permease family protein [Halieaceae bacterium]
MPIRQLLDIALRQTLDPGDGLSAFLSRLSILGLTIAVALLLAVMSVMNGFEREMRGRILELVPHVTVRGSAEPAAWQSVQQTILAYPGIKSVETFFDADALVLRGRDARALRLLGIEGDASRFSATLDHSAPALEGNHLLLGKGLAEQLSIKPGDGVTLFAPGTDGMSKGLGKPARFTVSGLIDTGTELDQQLAIAARAAVAEMVGAPDGINGIAVHLDDLFAAPRWRWQLSSQLPAWFYVTDWTLSHGNLYSAIQLSRNLILLLMASIIAVAAFNVVSSLVLVVTDRAKSIAMLRAVGARKRDIMTVYLVQGALIGGLGAAAGALLGWLLASIAPTAAAGLGRLQGRPLLNTDVYPLGFLPVSIEPQDFLLVGATALALCVIAAVLPAWRAAKLPVAATLNR